MRWTGGLWRGAGKRVGGLTTLALVLLSPSATFGQAWQVVEYYDTDAVGSIRVVTDAAGAVVARHDFLPFGEELSPQAPPHDKKLYTGQERDFETGQDYFRARYYRADLGRFTTVDPLMTIEEDLVDPQRWNRYVYVQDNPLRYVDPDGRYGVDVHYWMTWALARAAGYSHDSALEIATADASVDRRHNPFNPLFDFDARGDYHFPSAAREREVEAALDSGRLSLTEFGAVLHVLQDASSHADYGKFFGHLFAFDSPDTTAFHMSDAMKMAEDSFNKLRANLGPLASNWKWADIKDFMERALRAKSNFAKEAIYREMVEFLDEQQQ